jgi:hypothetical protein
MVGNAYLPLTSNPRRVRTWTAGARDDGQGSGGGSPLVAGYAGYMPVGTPSDAVSVAEEDVLIHRVRSTARESG